MNEPVNKNRDMPEAGGFFSAIITRCYWLSLHLTMANLSTKSSVCFVLLGLIHVAVVCGTSIFNTSPHLFKFRDISRVSEAITAKRMKTDP